jgi:hypothetical protein
LTPWKVATAALSSAALVFAAPFTGDPDWDTGVALLPLRLAFPRRRLATACALPSRRRACDPAHGAEGAAVFVPFLFLPS